ASDPLEVHIVPWGTSGWPTRLPGCVQRSERCEGRKRCEADHPPDRFTAKFEGRFRRRAKADIDDAGDRRAERTKQQEVRPCKPEEPAARRLLRCRDVGNLCANDGKDRAQQDDWPTRPLEYEPAPMQPAFSPRVAEPALYQHVDRDPQHGNRRRGREEISEAHVRWLKAGPKIKVRENEIQWRGDAKQVVGADREIGKPLAPTQPPKQSRHVGKDNLINPAGPFELLPVQ